MAAGGVFGDLVIFSQESIMQNFDFNRFNFFGNSSTSATKIAAKRRQGRLCRIEELEGREMLSVTPWSLTDNFADPFLNENSIGEYVSVPVPNGLDIAENLNILSPLGAISDSAHWVEKTLTEVLQVVDGLVYDGNEQAIMSAVNSAIAKVPKHTHITIGATDIEYLKTHPAFQYCYGGDGLLEQDHPFGISRAFGSAIEGIRFTFDGDGIPPSSGYPIPQLAFNVRELNNVWLTVKNANVIFTDTQDGVGFDVGDSAITAKGYVILETQNGGQIHMGTLTEDPATGRVEIIGTGLRENGTALTQPKTNWWSTSASNRTTPQLVAAAAAAGNWNTADVDTRAAAIVDILNGSAWNRTNVTLTTAGWIDGTNGLTKSQLEELLQEATKKMTAITNLHITVDGLELDLQQVKTLTNAYIIAANSGKLRIGTNTTLIGSGTVFLEADGESDIFVPKKENWSFETTPNLSKPSGTDLNYLRWHEGNNIFFNADAKRRPEPVLRTPFSETQTSVTVVWQNVDDSGLNYKVEYREGSGGVWTEWAGSPIVGATTSTITINGLVPNKEYFFRVMALGDLDDDGALRDSYWSVPVSRIPGAPAIPEGLRYGGEKDDHSIKLTWDAVTCDEYKIEWTRLDLPEDTTNLPDTMDLTKTKIISVSGDRAEYTIEDLTPGTEYRFRILAMNENGASGWSEDDPFVEIKTSGISPLRELTPPTINEPLTYPGATDTTWYATVTWNDVTTDIGGGANSATGYEFQYIRSDATDKSDDSTWITAEGSDLIRTITDLEKGAMYDIRIRALGNEDQFVSLPSMASAWAVKANVLLDYKNMQQNAPTNLKCTDGGGTWITLEWESVPNANGYRIQYATNSAFTDAKTVDVMSNLAKIEGLDKETTYYFCVLAKGGNRVGSITFTNSEYSAPFSQTTNAGLAQPVVTSAAALSVSTVKITWDKAADHLDHTIYADADNYEVWIKMDIAAGRQAEPQYEWVLWVSDWNPSRDATEFDGGSATKFEAIITGVPAGLEYEFVVRATSKSEAPSAFSVINDSRTKATTQPLEEVAATLAAAKPKITVPKNTTTIGSIALNLSTSAKGTKADQNAEAFLVSVADSAKNMVAFYLVDATSRQDTSGSTVGSIGTFTFSQFDPPEGEGTKGPLNPGSKYAFSVTAFNKFGNGTNQAGDKIIETTKLTVVKKSAKTAKYTAVKGLKLQAQSATLTSVTLQWNQVGFMPETNRIEIKITPPGKTADNQKTKDFPLVLSLVKNDDGQWSLDSLNSQNAKYGYLYEYITVTGGKSDGVLDSNWANPKKMRPTDAKAWTVTIDGLQPSFKYAFSLQCSSKDYGLSATAKKGGISTQRFAAVSKIVSGMSTAANSISLMWTLNSTAYAGEVFRYDVYWMKNKNTVGGTATITASEPTINGDLLNGNFIFSPAEFPAAGKKIIFYLQQVRTIAFGDALLTVKSVAAKTAIMV